MDPNQRAYLEPEVRTHTFARQYPRHCISDTGQYGYRCAAKQNTLLTYVN